MAEIHPLEIKQIPLFKELGRRDLKALAELFKRDAVTTRHEVCRQGEFGNTAYYVKSGELQVMYVDPQGTMRSVDRFGPGDFFGETSLLLGEPRDATIVALQDSELLYLRKDDFDALLVERPAISRALHVRDDVLSKLRAPRFPWQDEDELVILRLHKHDAILYRQLVFPILASLLGLACYAFLYANRDSGPLVTLPLVIGGTLFLVGPLPVLWYLIRDHVNDNYVVTTKRVVHEERKPLGRESRAEAPLRSIQDIQESQTGPLSQVYDFGDLIIETAGERGHVIFRQVPHPAETRDTIFQQIRRVQARARAEERVAIREAMESHFGLQPAEKEAEEPGPSAERSRLFVPPPWLTVLLRVIRTLIPPLREIQGETITWRKHWVALLRPIWLPSLLIAVLTIGGIAAVVALPENLVLILIGYGLLSLLLVPWWMWRYSDWQNDFYQVTATRIIDVERLPLYLREERREASLGAIQNIQLEIPGFAARLLNFGSVTIETAGTEPFTFDNVKDPRGVQTEIFRRVEAFQQNQRQQEAERHRAELLDWFSVYDQVRKAGSPAPQSVPDQQES